MSRSREDRIFEAFLAARELKPGDREPFVLREAAGDQALAAEVLSLLRHDSPTEDHIAQHARAAAAEMARADPEGLAAALGAVSPCADDALPERVGRYRVLRALGRGGYGRVFLAEQDSPQRLVALKVAHAQSSTTDRRRFRAEGEALARLQHPGIAQVYDAGVWRECGDRPYLVMEYIEGLALDDYAAAHALPRRRRLELLAQVCDAVAHAHRRGVIHRDLAPKNILVGADGAPRVLDFGVARLLGPGGVSDTLARDGVSLVGTLGYMSPEQLSSDPLQIDTRTDVYALGVIAYELLTGRRYLDVSDLTLTAALEAARSAPPARGSTIDRSLRGDLDAIVLKATERDIERRYPSASALASDIRRWLKDEPIEARAPSALYRTRKFARRHSAATAAAIVLLAGLTGAGAYALNARAAERESHAASLNALDAIITRVLAPLAPKLGSLDDRAELLAMIGPDVERIAARSPDGAQAQRIRARYLAAASDIEDGRGALDAALMLRAESLRVYKRLLDLAPADAETAHERSLALVRYGNLLQQAARHDDARAHYEEALAIDEAMVERHPEDLRMLSNLCWSYRRLDSFHEAERPALSRELAAKAAATAQRMSRLAPGAWRAIEARVETERRLSQLAFADGAIDDASAHGQAAASFADRLIAMDPQSRHVQSLLTLAYLAALEPLLAVGQSGEAEDLIDRAAATLRAAVGSDTDAIQRLMFDRLLLDLRLRVASAENATFTELRLVETALATMDALIELIPGEFTLADAKGDLLTRRVNLLECEPWPALRLSDAARLIVHAADVERRYINHPFASLRVIAWRRTSVDWLGAWRSGDAPADGGALASASIADRSRGVPDAHLPAGEVLDDDGAGADEGVGADRDAGADEGVGADPDIVSDRDRRPQER